MRQTRYKEIFLFVTFCLFKGHKEFIGGELNVPEYRTTRETNIIAQCLRKKKKKMEEVLTKEVDRKIIRPACYTR